MKTSDYGQDFGLDKIDSDHYDVETWFNDETIGRLKNQKFSPINN